MLDRVIGGIDAKFLRDITAPITGTLVVSKPHFARGRVEQIGAMPGTVHPPFNGAFGGNVPTERILCARESQVSEGTRPMNGPVSIRVLVTTVPEGTILGRVPREPARCSGQLAVPAQRRNTIGASGEISQVDRSEERRVGKEC